MPETYVDRYDVPATNNQLVLYKRSDLDSDAWWFRAKHCSPISYKKCKKIWGLGKL